MEEDQALPLTLNLLPDKEGAAANRSAFSLSLTDDLILLYCLALSFCFLSCAERPPMQKWLCCCLLFIGCVLSLWVSSSDANEQRQYLPGLAMFSLYVCGCVCVGVCVCESVHLACTTSRPLIILHCIDRCSLVLSGCLWTRPQTGSECQ